MPQAPLPILKPFTIGDRTWDGDSLAPAVAYTSTLAEELASNSSWIAFWGVQVGIAKKHHDDVQADYRAARDTFNSQERKKEKIAEKHLDERWRAADGYVAWYRRIADAEYAWNCAQHVLDACVKKSLNLSALSKHSLDEIHALNRAANAGRPR